MAATNPKYLTPETWFMRF